MNFYFTVFTQFKTVLNSKILFIKKTKKNKDSTNAINYIFSFQDKMQVDQEEGSHQKCHAEHTPEEEIDHTGTKTKVRFTISIVVSF